MEVRRREGHVLLLLPRYSGFRREHAPVRAAQQAHEPEVAYNLDGGRGRNIHHRYRHTEVRGVLLVYGRAGMRIFHNDDGRVQRVPVGPRERG